MATKKSGATNVESTGSMIINKPVLSAPKYRYEPPVLPLSEQLVYKVTGQPLLLRVPTLNIPSQYPSEWFDKNPNAKPAVSVSSWAMDIEHIDGVIAYGVRNNNLDVELVKAYLIRKLETIKSTLTENWSSYGVKIGVVNDTITPLDLILINIDHKIQTGVKTDIADPISPIAALILLLSPARITAGIPAGYEELLKERIRKLIVANGYPIAAFPPSVLYDTWSLDDSYMKLAAALDMFLVKFPEHPYGPVRISTLRLRHKDCASLLAVCQAIDLYDLTSNGMLARWLYTRKLAKELIDMMPEREEVMLRDSYFPYQSVFKLVNKTYYSASKAPHLYFVIHAASALIGSERSKNAIAIANENVTNNIRNAIILAYAHATTFSLESQFTPRDVYSSLQTEGEEEHEEFSSKVASRFQTLIDLDDNAPRSRDGSEWLAYMQSLDFQLTPKMRDFIEVAKAKMGETREGSIGEYIKQHF